MTNVQHNHNKAINADIAEKIETKKQEKLFKDIYIAIDFLLSRKKYRI